MKLIKILFLLLLPLIGFSQTQGVASSQTKADALPAYDENQIYNTAGIEIKPEYPGGIPEFYKYIGKNYKTPNVKGLQGKVFVTFIIEKDGSITDVKVLRDIGHGTGEEAVRVLKNCKNWIPGELNGRHVRVLYSLPISIQTR